MRFSGIRACWSTAVIVLCLQSLADIAREEAERRRQLEQQGIMGKVVEANPSPNANLTTSTVPLPAQKQQRSPSPKDRSSARSYRTALQKLDRTIRQEEARLESLRTRWQAGRWALPKVGRVSGSSQNANAQERLQRQIEDLQAKLKQLRQDRFEIYEAGKKAGFLPGELDGKGIMP